MKKWIILALVLVLLLAAGGAGGYYIWYQNSHIFVEDAVYEKDLTSLDLRGTGCSLAHYEAVRQQLPDCEIRYDLPFQGKFYPDDTTEITITSLTEEEVGLLDYLPKLQKVSAEGCTDYAQLLALKEHRPDCEITYTVDLYGKTYPNDTKELSFGSEQLDLQQLREALAYLPDMASITFDQPTVAAEELKALAADFENIDISWQKDAFGVTYGSDVTEIDLSGMCLTSLDQVEQALVWFPNLEKVILCDVGPGPKEPFDDETMAAFREKMRPEYKVVWAVKIYGLKVRTDDLYFMPVKHGVKVFNFEVQKLRYCEDMLCVDIGHMPVTDLSFLEGMKSLKYFILVDSPLIYIDPIANCKNLIYVELFRTEIQDLSPLIGCTALQDLNVTRTKADPMVLKEMTWLKNLWVSKHQIKKEEDQKALQEALPNTFIQFSDYNLLARNGWRDLQNYFDMRDLLGMPYNTW